MNIHFEICKIIIYLTIIYKTLIERNQRTSSSHWQACLETSCPINHFYSLHLIQRSEQKVTKSCTQGVHVFQWEEKLWLSASWRWTQQNTHCHFVFKCAFCTEGFPGGTNDKEPACQCRRHKRCGFDPWVRNIPWRHGKIPWRRAWRPTLVFLPGESPWTEELGGLQSMQSQRAGHDGSDLACRRMHFAQNWKNQHMKWEISCHTARENLAGLSLQFRRGTELWEKTCWSKRESGYTSATESHWPEFRGCPKSTVSGVSSWTSGTTEIVAKYLKHSHLQEYFPPSSFFCYLSI